MQPSQKYEMRERVMQLFLPLQRLQCDSCGKEKWAWAGAMAAFRSGEVPPALLMLFAVAMLALACWFAR